MTYCQKCGCESHCGVESKKDARNQLHDVITYWEERTKKVQEIADKCPTMYEFLGKHLYNN